MLKLVFFALLIVVAQATVKMTFTNVPAYGATTGNLEGTITGLTDAELESYVVAAYIFTDSWWSKPNTATPTTVPTGGTFSIDVTLHGSDPTATRVCAVLFRNTSVVDNDPALAGVFTLPSWMSSHLVAGAQHKRGGILFDSSEFFTKKSYLSSTAGPGPNYFDPDSVWKEPGTGVVMKVSNHSSLGWVSSEIHRPCEPLFGDCLGYGWYVFTVLGHLSTLDSNVVFGLFTWETQSAIDSHRELDFEFARWGNPSDVTNAQFVVQPHTTTGNLRRVTIPDHGDMNVTCAMLWQNDRILFRYLLGHHSIKDMRANTTATRAMVIDEWEYTNQADIPEPGYEWVHINLWQFNSNPPASNTEQRVVVANFEHSDIVDEFDMPRGCVEPAISPALLTAVGLRPETNVCHQQDE